MSLKCVTIFFLINFKQLFSFNLDTNFPIVYTDPTDYSLINNNITSYFGYSVILYPGSNISPPWIQIGAPRGSSPQISFPNPGVIFRCGIAEHCRLINVDLENKYDGNECKTNFSSNWNGVSMDINYENQRIVVCGHRWIRRTYDYYMHGACYWSHINDSDKTYTKLTPLCAKGRDTLGDKRGVFYYYGQGQAGTSAHFSQRENELLLGAPGLYNWAGGIVRYKDQQDLSPEAKKYVRTHNKRYVDFETQFSQIGVTTAVYSGGIYAYNLFGYTISSGYFSQKNQLLYVTGAPKAKLTIGQILIYDFGVNDTIIVKEIKYGEQIGEYFGASLGVGDVNGDGFDDLIVGSPFYSEEKFNEGKIYIYFGRRNKDLQYFNVIIGKAAQGQFGSAIQYLGDMDHDGFGDFAIGAPYEDEQTGVVYIYKGNRNGLNIEPCQRIAGKSILPNIRGFGISISKPADIDSNDYNDFAIGAHKSGHTILLRTSPVVVIRHSIDSLVSHVNLNEIFFNIEVCFWFLIYKGKENVNISRTIVIDEQLGRAVLNDPNSYAQNISMSKMNKRECETLAIRLKQTNIKYFDSIPITLSHEFITRKIENETIIVSSNNVTGTDRFCVRCPVYNKYLSSKTETINVPLALGCKNVTKCKTYLQLESSFDGLGKDNIFVLDSSNYLQLKTIVVNLGENAYLTQLITVLPETINFRQIPTFCDQLNSSAISCFVDNPLKENKQKTISFELDMKNINSGKYDEQFLEIFSEILTSSENSNGTIKKTIINLKREADITITGKSGEQSYYYGGNMTTAKLNFTQIYEVEKFGISPIDQVQIEINIPREFLINNQKNTNESIIEFMKLYPVNGYLGGQPINCKSDFEYILDDMNLNNELDISNNDKSTLERKVRQVDVFQVNDVTNETHESLELANKENNELLFENRTFYINCSMDEVLCSKVICTAGPFKSKLNLAILEIKMVFDLNLLKGVLRKEKDIILLSTYGSVTITTPSNFVQTGNRSDVVTVSSLFIGEKVTKTIEIWILILSAILGIILLVLIIYGLIQVGFFKRTKKYQLDELKAQAENDSLVNEECEEEMDIKTEVSDFEIKTEENSLNEQPVD